MFDKELAKEIFNQILIAASRIERRCECIHGPDDFLLSDAGIDKLDGICMMLIAIGENLKNLDKVTGHTPEGFAEITFPHVTTLYIDNVII